MSCPTADLLAVVLSCYNFAEAMSRTDINPGITVTVPGTTTIKTFNAKGVLLSSRTDLRNRERNYQYRSGTVTPSYPRRLEEGTLPQNAFTYSGSYQSFGYGYDYTVDKATGYRTTTDGCMSQQALVTPSLSALMNENLKNRAKSKALLKIKAQDVNLAQAWAERAQTQRLLAESVNSLGRCLSALKKGNIRAAAAALGVKPPKASGGFTRQWQRNQSKAVANGWLQLQYGWRPLIADMYGYVQHLKKVLEGTSNVIRVSAKATYSDVVNTVVRDGNLVTTTVSSLEVETTCRLYYLRTNPVLAELSSYGITNPGYLAWELTKFSFVIDWAVRIGDWISTLDATFGHTFQTSSITTFTRAKIHKSLTCSGPYGAYSSKLTNINQWAEDVSTNRSLLTGLSVMPSLPVFKDPSGLEHFLNALALLKTHKR